jgi:hypothetical protein
MPQLTSTQSGLIVSVASGNTLRIYSRSGTATVTGSTVTVEDATATLGCFVYGPQTSAANITISTSGVCDYDVVAGDPTPDRNLTFNPTNGITDPASAAAVRGASFALTSGVWTLAPTISRLRLVGTGALSIDSRDRAGTVSTAVFTGSYSGAAGTIEFPYYGDAAVQIRATFPNTLTVEVL